jgi:hypothetical protein
MFAVPLPLEARRAALRSSHGREPVEQKRPDLYLFFSVRAPDGAIERRSAAPPGLKQKGKMEGLRPSSFHGLAPRG